MSLTPMAFSPATGLSDTATYPSAPGSGAAARAQIQGRLNELRDYINNTLLVELTKSSYIYAASSAGSDTYAVTLTPAPTAYATGMVVNFLADVGNTGAATLNVNSLGAKAITKDGATALETGDIPAGRVVSVIYDGTRFQIVEPTLTAASLLALLLTVDGTGSGLDADKLDGNEATAFVLASLLSAAGDIPYASGVGTWARLAKGTDGQVLTLASGVPSWADAESGAETWTVVDAFTRASDSTFTVTDDAAHQAICVAGRPIRYKATGGSYVYGIITGYTTGTVTLAGAPMTTSYDDVLEYGDMNRVVQVDVMIPSSFASAGASSTLINTWLKANLLWRYGAAYLVRFGHVVDVDDSGAAQTNVNVNVAGSAVGTANTNAGPTISETWTYTTTDINTTNYSIAQDEEIEITCDATGTNDNATDLAVSLTFVLA